jgi:hypothetical protein
VRAAQSQRPAPFIIISPGQPHPLLDNQGNDVLDGGKGKGESSLSDWEAIRGTLKPV